MKAKGLLLATLLLGLRQSVVINAQTWCGKNYMQNQTVEPPGGKFPPITQEAPGTLVLTFRCHPTIQPYLPGDENANPTVLVYSDVSDTIRYPDSQPYSPPAGWPGPMKPEDMHDLTVTVTVDGTVVATGQLPAVPATGPDNVTEGLKVSVSRHEVPLALGHLRPRNVHYHMECSARTQDGQTFTSSSKLSYLPNPPSGSVTKRDLRTGALLARGPNGSEDFAPIFPIGFYTQFDEYLTGPNRALVLSELKDEGFNTIHPIPPFPNNDVLDRVLDDVESAGLYLMYDMRWTYQNRSQVTAEVNRIKNRKNLLLWYTADEPDGTSDPLDATLNSYNLINSLDGGDDSGGVGYHPVSLVLNCQDYEFTSYARGADIIMQDVYQIGNDVTFSSEYNTECTPDFGVCGCDNCQGLFSDISERMDTFRERMAYLNWQTKSLWSVPQAFGEAQYWKRYPTGKEFVVQSALSIIHGAKGIIAWTDPTTPEIKTAASNFAKTIPIISIFVLDPTVVSFGFEENGVEIMAWRRASSKSALVLAMNTKNEPVSFDLGSSKLRDVYGPTKYHNQYRYFEGANISRTDGDSVKGTMMLESTLHFEGHGTLALVFESDMTGAVDNGTSSIIDNNRLVVAGTIGILIISLIIWRP